jgi:hypothetical protein
MSRNRSEFSPSTKRALENRANQRCSLKDCRQPTSGPSDEAPDKRVQVGDASHIHAASSNGPRYLASMTDEERAHIDNGIWLCATHNRLVDGDTCYYTADELRAMKAEHEASVRAEIEGRFASNNGHKRDLIALGPNIVWIGEVVGSDQNAWELKVDEFLEGDLHALMQYIETFSAQDLYHQYVLVNELGDGRQLDRSPSWRKEKGDYFVKAHVKPSAERTNVHKMPSDLRLGPTHDLETSGGDWALVSGFDAFKQKMSVCLSTQKGEMWFHPTFGVRFIEYAQLYEGSPWLPHFIKMEVIRMASLPFSEAGNLTKVTPLHCIRRVHNVEIAQEPAHNLWQPFHFDIELEGFGVWKGNIPIYYGG